MTAMSADFWGEPISVYGRAQAIEDGVLVDVTDTAREAGFKHPVAITIGLHAVLEAPSRSGEDYSGRLWDVVSVGFMRFMQAIKADRERFEQGDTRVPYQLRFSGRVHDVYLTVNPYEGFTILLNGED